MSTKATKQLTDMAKAFHALSDETRLLILEQLKEGEECVCDLTEAFKTGQSRLSFHLRVLKEAGLVLDRPEGRWVYYSLNREAIEDLREALNSLNQSSHRSGKKGCCQ
jgi:ArsR family transcriptional regulator